MIIYKGPPLPELKIEIGPELDPEEKARHVKRTEQFMRNVEWVQKQWGWLRPKALGKYIAVAGQEAFIADTGAEARQLAKAAHPDDEGIYSQYIRPTPGPRTHFLEIGGR